MRPIHPSIASLSVALFTLFTPTATASPAEALGLEDIFPRDRLIDVQITIPQESWDALRHQSRDIFRALGASRRHTPPATPFTYFDASIRIDGVEFPRVAIRKKGFLGSQSTVRPSLKVRLDHAGSNVSIGGLTNLTLNNNQQDTSLVSQYLSYAIFNAAGTPAPRCAFAKVTVNGKYLGVYTHVETVRRTLLERGFGDASGTLFEGTVVDFYEGWENSLEYKRGDEARGREAIRRLIEELHDRSGMPLLSQDAEVRAHVPTDDSIGSTWTTGSFDDSAWVSGRGSAGYESSDGYEDLIGETLDFEKQLSGREGSIYLRYRFDTRELNDAVALTLGVRYDDGFVAYLNGERVASANAPGEPAWNSFATAVHDDNGARTFQPFSIAKHLDRLRPRDNVLAIHGLNADSSSSDMLIAADLRVSDRKPLSGLGELVELDAFYRYWALEGLLGFWDGYSGNRNNFFVYLHPRTSKIHFMPWGADSLFVHGEEEERGQGAPISVKTAGLIANRLYQTEEGRARYRRTLHGLLDEVWTEAKLIAETERLEKLLAPAARESRWQGEFVEELARIREFIGTRRAAILEETKNGMPIFTRTPGPPPLIPFGKRGEDDDPDDDDLDDLDDLDAGDVASTIWTAARRGDLETLERLLDGGIGVDATDVFGTTALGWAVIFGRIESVELLIEAGANVNARNGEERTPLDEARRKLEPDEIEFLEQLLDTEIELEDIERNRPKIVERLRNAGARTSEDLRRSNPRGER